MTTTMLFVYPGLGPYLRKFRQLLCKITRGGVESNPDRGEVGWGISAEPPAASKPHFAQSRVLSYIYYHSQESASVDPALTPRHSFWIPEWLKVALQKYVRKTLVGYFQSLG